MFCFRSVSRKRAAATKSDASVLKHETGGVLSPVPETRVTCASVDTLDNSGIAATPALKKKRKLYKQTPQLSEVRQQSVPKNQTYL